MAGTQLKLLNLNIIITHFSKPYTLTYWHWVWTFCSCCFGDLLIRLFWRSVPCSETTVNNPESRTTLSEYCESRNFKKNGD